MHSIVWLRPSKQIRAPLYSFKQKKQRRWIVSVNHRESECDADDPVDHQIWYHLRACSHILCCSYRTS